MRITNYTTLQTAVSNHLNRTDLSSAIQDLILLAEAKLNRRLRVREQQTQSTGAVAASVALPSDFAELISLTVTDGSDVRKLDYVDPGQITGKSSTTYHYSIVGSNIIFDPVQSGITYTLTYFAKIPTIESNDNWLVTNSPDVYLYASLLEAEPYLKNDQRIAVWSSMLQDSIESLSSQGHNDRRGNNMAVRAA